MPPRCPHCGQMYLPDVHPTPAASTDAQPHGANGCPLCGEHLADPHAPECALGRASDLLADRDAGAHVTPAEAWLLLSELVRAVSSGGVAYPG